MKKFLTPASFHIALAAVATALGFAMQYGLVPPAYVPVVAALSTMLAGALTPPKKETP